MKIGLRIPSLSKRIAARTSWKRVVRHSLGLKAPRGFGWLTNPRKAAYNRIYSRTTFGVGDLLGGKRRTSASPSGCGCLMFIVVLGIGMLTIGTCDNHTVSPAAPARPTLAPVVTSKAPTPTRAPDGPRPAVQRKVPRIDDSVMYQDAPEVMQVSSATRTPPSTRPFSLLGISKPGDDPRKWFFQVRTIGGANKLLHLGQEIEGWTLDRVDGSSLVLRKGETEQVLERQP